MRSRVSDSIFLLLLLLLATISLAWKGAVSHQSDVLPAEQLARTVARQLASQGFRSDVQQRPYGGPVVQARRGDCRLNVRDATNAADAETTFTQAARSVGPVTYLYDGQRYKRPPAIRMRLGRFVRNLAQTIGLSLPAKVPLALAASPACGEDSFRLDRLRIVAWLRVNGAPA